MSELRIGTATSEPAAGTLKVGSGNVQEIYLGSTKIWPSAPSPTCDEIQIGSLIWVTCNSLITQSSQGSIPILTTEQEVADAYANLTAGAVYYNFNSANAYRGLLYNKRAATSIIPPAGFRSPTVQDWNNLLSELSNTSGQTGDYTPGGGGNNALWNQTIQSRSDYGLSGFDSIKAGDASYTNSQMNWSPTGREFWWNLQSNIGTNAGIGFVEQSNYISAVGVVSFEPYWYIRFCKDA